MMFDNAQRNALLKAHQDSVNALNEAKALESKLRMEVLTSLFSYDENNLRSGTENIDLGDNWVCKAEFKTSHKLDNKDNAVEYMLDKLESMGEEGKFLAERIVKFKPELSLTEYKTLPSEYRAIVDTVVTTKNSLPTVSIVQRKR